MATYIHSEPSPSDAAKRVEEITQKILNDAKERARCRQEMQERARSNRFRRAVAYVVNAMAT